MSSAGHRRRTRRGIATNQRSRDPSHTEARGGRMTAKSAAGDAAPRSTVPGGGHCASHVPVHRSSLRDENRCDSQFPDPGGRHRFRAAALAHIRSPVGQRLSRLMDHHRLRARVWHRAPGRRSRQRHTHLKGRVLSALTAPRFWKSETARLPLSCEFRGYRQSSHSTVGVPSGARAGCSGSAHPGDGQGGQNARRHRGDGQRAIPHMRRRAGRDVARKINKAERQSAGSVRAQIGPPPCRPGP